MSNPHPRAVAVTPPRHIQVLEVLGLWWPGHEVHQLHNVLVAAKMAQQLDLSQDALGVDEVLEDVANALDGHLTAGELVFCAADKAVSALVETKWGRTRHALVRYRTEYEGRSSG